MAVFVNFYILLNFVHNASIFYCNIIKHPKLGNVVQRSFYYVCRPGGSVIPTWHSTGCGGGCWGLACLFSAGSGHRSDPSPCLRDAAVSLAMGMGTEDEQRKDFR